MNESHKAMIEDYIKAYNSFDIDGMIENLSDHVVFQNISAGEVNMTIKGIDAFKSQAMEAKDYFRQREQSITEWKFDKNQVAISLNYHAVLAIDFSNGMNAGDELNMTGQSIFDFANGRIIKIQDIA